MYIPKTECLSPLDTWPEPSVGAWPHSRGTFTLKHQLTCPIMTDWPQACCILSLSHLSTCSFTHLFTSHTLASSTLSVSAPEGFHLHSTCPDSCTVHHFMHRSMVTDQRGVCIVVGGGVKLLLLTIVPEKPCWLWEGDSRKEGDAFMYVTTEHLSLN